MIALTILYIIVTTATIDLSILLLSGCRFVTVCPNPHVTLLRGVCPSIGT